MKALRLPRDGRYYILINHILLVVLGFVVFEFQRTWAQLAIGLSCTFAAELLATRLTTKNPGAAVLDRLLSAAITALSLFLLINSPSLWFYGYGGVIAVLSKYILRLDRKRHIFNPTNVAIVVLLACLTPHHFQVLADEFSLYPYPIAQVLFFGWLATSRADRWVLSLSYLATIAVGGGLLSVLTAHGWLYYFGSEVGASGLTFIWLMITDPKTSPRGRVNQALFAAAIAAFSLTFKYYEVVYGPFLALFLASGIRALVIGIEWTPSALRAARPATANSGADGVVGLNRPSPASSSFDEIHVGKKYGRTHVE